MIDIIIPNWNGRKLLGACLSSLEDQKSNEFRVTVVDNGSNDGSLEFISTRYPHINVISLPENKGFSSAINVGINATTHPWIMLLNNDTEVDKNCITCLLENIEKKKEYDFFALKMIDFKSREKIDGAGDAVLRGGVGYRLGTLELDSDYYSVPREVFGACAGAALYKRSLFEKIGLFDEDFFAYLEDVDLNMRAVRAGFKCCYLPDAKIFHIGSASSGSKINNFTVSLSTRNNIFVILKNFTPILVLRFFPAIIIYQLFWLLFVIKNRQFIAYVKGLFRSIKYFPKMIRRGIESRNNKNTLSNKVFGTTVLASEKQAVESIMNRRSELGKNNKLLEIYLKLFC